jgi:AhpD family alkylhydroperoxidase
VHRPASDRASGVNRALRVLYQRHSGDSTEHASLPLGPHATIDRQMPTTTVGQMRFDPYANGVPWYQDLLVLAGHLRHGPLDAAICQLVEVRVSQITGCAFCLGLHSELARTAGIDEAKLDMLAGWRDAPHFDQRERAALGLAEAVTRLGDGQRVNDGIWSAARKEFTDDELAALLYLIGLINVWNRINVAVELPSDHQLPQR